MIKIDMEMPESCMKCPLSPENWVYATCKIAGKAVWLTKRPSWCPLIEETDRSCEGCKHIDEDVRLNCQFCAPDGYSRWEGVENE